MKKDKQFKKIIFVLAATVLFIQLVWGVWSPRVRITWNASYSGHPEIALDNLDNIHVVWYDSMSGNSELYYKNSTDAGLSWSANKRLTWSTNDTWDPIIAIDSSNNLHVAFLDNTSGNFEIYYKRSTDGGATWPLKRRLTWNQGDSKYADMMLDGSDNIHVIWGDFSPGNFEIYYKKSTDLGVNWSALKRLVWNSGQSIKPEITSDAAGGLHVTWQDNTPGNEEIFYKYSGDNGTTWGPCKRITWNASSSESPDINMDLSKTVVHLVWQDVTSGAYELYYRQSTDSGATWSPRQRLTWKASWCGNPRLDVDSTNAIFIFFHSNVAVNDEIFYKKSTTGGASWMGAQRLTWSSGWSGNPRTSIDSGDLIHVIWHDNTPGNDEIFYRNGK